MKNGPLASALPRIRPPVIVAAGCCVFVLLGLALIPYAGIETDEPVFANPLYQPVPTDFRIRLFHHDFPLMIVSYAGTLKTLLYWPILGIFPPTAFTLRVPMVLVGAITIFIFYRLAALVAESEAAVLAALLVATDPTFLLTNTFDWGPVALEHLLLVAGCLMMVKRRFAPGCFFFGLALWNKATFAWALAGLVAGIVVACWPELRRAAGDRRTVVLAACAFLSGALPFIVYNVHRPNVTLRSNAHLAFDDLNTKFRELKLAADGSGLLGFIAEEEWAGDPKTPASGLGRAAAWIREHLGPHRTSLVPYAILMALVTAPVWWRLPGRRAALFAIVFSVVTFAGMAVTRGAGVAIHHAVLLWPMPHLLVGVAAAAWRPRWLLRAVGAVLVASNLLVINQYIFQLERYGAYGNFTDALYPLSNALSELAGQKIYDVDWGMYDNVNFLHWGKLALRPSADPLITGAPDEAQRREVETMLADSHGVFLAHVRSLETLRGVGEHLDAAARALGYQKEPIRTIPDSNGRPVFELFRFHHSTDGP